MFSRSEKVIYPGYGVAHINRVVEKKIAGTIKYFFELKFLNKDMIVLIPLDNEKPIGIRKLSSKECIEVIFKMLALPFDTLLIHDMSMSNWNKRNKEYQAKLRRGDLVEIGEIYRDLQYISLQKELSFGERALLQQTETLLVEEISLINNMTEEDTVLLIRKLLPQGRIAEKNELTHAY